MMMNKRKVFKLYNVIFPIWMLVFFPQTWLIVIPANFIVDSLVLFISILKLKINEKKVFYKKYILRIFTFGMISDIIGSLFLFALLMLRISQTGDEFYFTIPAVVLSAFLIYMLNYYFTFQSLDRNIRLKLSIVFAIITAPYTFLIPLNWLY